MSNEQTTKGRGRFRGGLFFPVLLVTLGVIFLLNNLHILAGDAWDTLLKLWPFLLILLGLDGILRRDGLVGGVLLIGIGVVFLLSNFNVLALNVWETILRLWPILIIAIGFDILIGRRRHLLISLIALLLILAILAGAVWFLGLAPESGGQALLNRQIDQTFDTAQRARVAIEPGAGSLRLNALSDETKLVSGSVPATERSQSVKRYFSVQDDEARLTLRGEGYLFFWPGNNEDRWVWNLGLNPKIPIDLVVSLGAGESDLDLSALNLTGFKISMGVGQTTVTLPSRGVLKGQLNGAIGQLVILVPNGIGVKIQANTGLVGVNAPASYQKQDRQYTSPNYASAENRIDLEVGLAIGGVDIVQK